MELAGDVVQDLCKKLGVADLESEADFPGEMAAFGAVLADVTEYHLSRSKLTADMADSSQRVKALVVRAEDARQLNEMALMKQHYIGLFTMNGELIGEYAKRANNHAALLDALKKVNAMISKASNLRAGKAKTAVVTQCRKAIKAQAFDNLFAIVQTGGSKKIAQ
jgi:Bardet-Biedl syndrome 2 protein